MAFSSLEYDGTTHRYGCLICDLILRGLVKVHAIIPKGRALVLKGYVDE